MMPHARFSAPRPLRSSRPATTSATDQPVRNRLKTNTASARPMRPEIEAEEHDREQRDRDRTDRQPDDAHGHQRDDEFGRPQRAHHQVAHVAGVQLFEERDRKAKLPPEQDVPQDHGGNEGARGLRKEIGMLRDVELKEAPHQHLHHRPVHQIEDARPGRFDHVPVPQHDRADAPRRECDVFGRLHAHCAASDASLRPRAMSRNTSSRLVRP